jgi:DNA repair protein RecN (Recombination protein N)
MLLELRIKDFAIIDDLSVTFGRGLNVFTGETGAGKSIIIDAIDLVLGDRAQTDLVRGEREEAHVEALFDISSSNSMQKMLEEAGIASSENLVIKRVIQRAGRNRVYINGNLATLVTLTEVGRHLIDIYGQSEHQSLTRPEEHVELLDYFGGFSRLREEMALAHATWAMLQSELEKLEALIKSSTEDRELLISQSKEIEDAALRPGEDLEIKKEKDRLQNSERLLNVTGEAERSIYSDEGAIVERLGALIKKLKDVAMFDQNLVKTIDTLNSALYSLEDAAAFLRDYASSIESDPERLEEVDGRLDSIVKLKRKYGRNIDEILARKAEIDKGLGDIIDHEEKLKDLLKRTGEAREKAVEVASRLTRDRQRAAGELKEKLEKELEGLGMKGCVFEPIVETDANPDGTPRLGEKGSDRVSFLISTNPGEEIMPLARIASGGELSRIMLAMKGLTAAGRVPTLIFDEVDTGVSGLMAQVVGSRLKGVSSTNQVICITHLPQVAAFADGHYYVSKKETGEGRTVTRVKELEGDERVEDLARMLGGTEITETTRKHARELIEAAMKG